MADFLHSVDIWLLLAAKGVVEWSVEWLSLRQRWIEIALQAGIAMSVSVICVDSIGALPRWTTGLLICIYAFIVRFNCGLHMRPDRVRTEYLLTGYDAGRRIWQLGCALAFMPLDVFTYRSELRAFVVNITFWLCTVPFYYVVALPNSGTPGRRRKRALERLSQSLSPMAYPVRAREGLPCIH